QKLMILLTDGNDTASKVPPAHAADIAQQKGIVIYTIGVGDPAATGENRVDLAALRDVASVTRGRFFRAEDGADLTSVHADIDKLAAVKLQPQTWRPKLPLFQWPLAVAVALTLAFWGALLVATFASRRTVRHA